MLLTIRAAKLMTFGMTFALALPVFAQDQQSTDGAERQRQEQMFGRLDSNADGNVNFEEFSAVPLPGFDRRDSNGDGSISRDEVLEQRFLRLDRDGNGLLSADELRSAAREGRSSDGRRRGGEQRMEGMGEMRERMQNMSPEQRAQMRERMQNMTPEQRRAMHAQMRQNGQHEAAEDTGGNAPAHNH